MPELKPEQLARYLSSSFGEQISVLDVAILGYPEERTLKGYGYGTPVRIDYELSDHQRRSAVLHTMSPGPFGHEHMADRAHILLWEHRAFNLLPRHVRSLVASYPTRVSCP